MNHRSNGNSAGLAVRIPDHVVFRGFVSETVVLNLHTGQYHGLNPVAGRMLEVLGEDGRLEPAIAILAEEFKQPVERIEEDLTRLRDELLTRELLEVVEHGDA
ncbi:MAG TPA: PqqD family protein [Thermoleophilaceae bacterium]|nr:PqqD family protein [Thermoleophilaceae bacterium]